MSRLASLAIAVVIMLPLRLVAQNCPCRFDLNHDGVVDEADRQAFLQCFGAGGGPGCEYADYDGNGFISVADYSYFLAHYQAAGSCLQQGGDPVTCCGTPLVPPNSPGDCNTNRIPDTFELACGLASDGNTNSVPDECEVSLTAVFPTVCPTTDRKSTRLNSSH